jgi:hypothetical protein
MMPVLPHLLIQQRFQHQRHLHHFKVFSTSARGSLKRTPSFRGSQWTTPSLQQRQDEITGPDLPQGPVQASVGTLYDSKGHG